MKNANEVAASYSAEDAQARRIPSESWLALIALWLVYAMNSNARQMLFYVVPYISKEFSLDAPTVGLYTTLIMMATAVIAIPSMVWADNGGHGWRRKYRHLPFAIGYTSFTCLTGVNVVTVSIGALVAIQVIAHAFSGAGEAIEVTSLAEWWSKERRGLALGVHHTGAPWGILLGSIATSYLLSRFGPQNWRLVFLLFPVPMVFIFLFYWYFSSNKRYQSLNRKLSEYGQSSPLSHAGEGGGRAPKGSFLIAFKNPNVSVIALVSLLAIVGGFGLAFWLPQYLAFVAHYDFAQIAAYSAVFTITGGLGQIFWGWISDRLGRKFCLMLLFLWLAVATYLYKYTYLGLTELVVIQLFGGFALFSPYTLVYAIAFDSTRQGTNGVAGSIINFGIYLGGFGPYVVGVLIGLGGGFGEVLGYNYALYFLAGLMLFALVITGLFTRETTGWFRRYDRALVSRDSCNLQT
jgi:sugar phosphate permease